MNNRNTHCVFQDTISKEIYLKKLTTPHKKREELPS